jgi:2'-5' RNA ligase
MITLVCLGDKFRTRADETVASVRRVYAPFEIEFGWAAHFFSQPSGKRLRRNAGSEQSGRNWNAHDFIDHG